VRQFFAAFVSLLGSAGPAASPGATSQEEEKQGRPNKSAKDRRTPDQTKEKGETHLGAATSQAARYR
jgi:hypothetical protein